MSKRLAVSPDSRYVAVTGYSTTHLWDLDEDTPTAVTIRGGGFSSLEFIRANRLSLCQYGSWVVYDPATRQNVSRSRATVKAARVGAVPGGDCTLESAHGANLSLWRVKVQGGETTRERVWVQPHTDIGSVLFTPDATRFVAYRGVYSLDTWSMYRTADGVHLADLEPRGTDLPARMHFTLDGVTLWGGHGSAIYSWDALAGGGATLRFEHATFGRSFFATARHPDGHILAAVTGDQSVHFFEPDSGTLLKTYEWPVAEIELVAFTPDGTRCVVAGHRGEVLLFDVE